MSFLLYPYFVFNFWYLEAPVEILKFYKSLNFYLVQLFSLPLLIKTFFRPLKNEYRKGLVGFSFAMGIAIKTFLIFFDLLLLAAIFLVEAAFLAGFVAFPLLPFLLFIL